MYPKVRVRSLEEDDDDFEFDSPKPTPLKAFTSLAIRDCNPPPAKEGKQASSLSVAKVPKLHIPRSVTPTHALPKAQVRSEAASDDTNRKHNRASSMPRPRAVISSPDNDELLGSKNRTRIQRLSGLKSRNMSEGIPTECKLAPSSTGKNALKRAVETKKAASRTSNAETKKEATYDIRVPRASIVKAKPCFSVT